MNPLALGLLVGAVTMIVLFAGVPVAFALGAVAVLFLVVFDGVRTLDIVPENLLSGLDDFTLVSIPMFILMGAAVASSRAGSDIYEALERWLNRIPGSLVISNIGASALFAALTGSSPACCAAIGKMGIPEMRRRGYPDDLATGSIAAGGTLGILIPPSITMILYGVATETSIGRLFLAGVVPGLMLTLFFMIWAWLICWRRGIGFGDRARHYSWRERFEVIPRVLPFMVVITGVVWALYGGIATPSEAAGVGAAACFALAVLIYRMWSPAAMWQILRDTTRESVMIMLIIAASILFGYMLSSLYITQSAAGWIAALEVNRWILLFWINVFLLVAGCFLPPAAIILMTAPILVPIITSAGFDPIWFGVMLTINMELGLITPPIGLNLYVINGIVPDVRLSVILRGALPFMLCMNSCHAAAVLLARAGDRAAGHADGTGTMSKSELASPDADHAKGIVVELYDREDYPSDALADARAHWQHVRPLLLEMIETYIGDPDPVAADYEPLFFLIHLAAELRETSVCKPLLRMLVLDPDRLEELLGDSITATLPSVMASVFDGDLEPMRAAILDPKADEFIRAGVLDALAFLTAEGRIARDWTIAFLREFEAEAQPRSASYVWYSWQGAIVFLGIAELADAAREAFRDGRIETALSEHEDFDADWQQRSAAGENEPAYDFSDVSYFGDTFAELTKHFTFAANDGIAAEFVMGPRVDDAGRQHLPRRRAKRPVSLRQRQEVQEMLSRQ